MSRTLLLSTTMLALMATSVLARPQVVLSRDNRTVTLAPGTVLPRTTKFAPTANYLYTNLAVKEKKGLYLASVGFTISGPSSIFEHAYGIAEQFKLKVDASVTTLTAGVAYVSGDQTVTMTLYADNGSNSPGAVLASGTGEVNTELGFCCSITSVSFNPVKLRAHKPYWIAITTTGSNFEAVAAEIANQVDDYAYRATTSDGGNTWSAGVLGFATDLPAIGID